jgi:23S rRNA (cytosine1962-C5)-methyltransferase
VDLHLLEAALCRRQSLKSHTNALRLVNGIGDGLEGLILEQYGHHFVAQIFHKRWFAEKETLKDLVKTRCGGRYLIIKDRTESVSSRPEAIRTSVWIGIEAAEASVNQEDVFRTVIEENSLRFGVDLNDTLNSGLFLDMRRNRQLVAGLARGRRVLNCFAYTCSFGVYCRAAGAESVVNVDISRKSLSRGRSNYDLNRLVPSRNEFIRADAVQYLERALAKDNRFDLIILDPPSFARHEGRSFSVRKDLSPLIGLAMNVLNSGGLLFVSTNLIAVFHDSLEAMVRAAAQRRRIKRIQRLSPDEDFRGSGPATEGHLAALLVEV